MPTIAVFSPEFGQRIKTAVEGIEAGTKPIPSKNANGILAGYTSPMEIIGAWTQDGGLWQCRAKRLWKTGGGYEPRDDGQEITLHSFDAQQPEATGRVFAVWRGIWEMVSSASAGNENAYAVVTENIQCPDDVTATPVHTDFRNKLGRIKIVGKKYNVPNTDDYTEGGEGQTYYDYCACLELAGKDDDHPEQILAGVQVKIVKAGTFNNPDYVPASETAAEQNPPEKYEWYTAVETPVEYIAPLDGNLQWNGDTEGTTTITLSDVLFTVHGGMIPQGYKCNANAEHYIARRISGKLYIVGGTCPEEEA